MSLYTLAQELESKGRAKDTRLVHMTPNEVNSLQGLAVANGGSLTINPETGLPEAGFLDFLLPIIAGVALGPAGVGMSSAMAGLSVGAGTTLVTGDLGKGFAAGFGAYSASNLGSSEALLGKDAFGWQAKKVAAAAAKEAAGGVAGGVAEQAARIAAEEAAKHAATGGLSAAGEFATTAGQGLGIGPETLRSDLAQGLGQDFVQGATAVPALGSAAGTATPAVGQSFVGADLANAPPGGGWGPVWTGEEPVGAGAGEAAKWYKNPWVIGAGGLGAISLANQEPQGGELPPGTSTPYYGPFQPVPRQTDFQPHEQMMSDSSEHQYFTPEVHPRSSEGRAPPGYMPIPRHKQQSSPYPGYVPPNTFRTFAYGGEVKKYADGGLPFAFSRPIDVGPDPVGQVSSEAIAADRWDVGRDAVLNPSDANPIIPPEGAPVPEPEPEPEPEPIPNYSGYGGYGGGFGGFGGFGGYGNYGNYGNNQYFTPPPEPGMGTPYAQPGSGQIWDTQQTPNSYGNYVPPTQAPPPQAAPPQVGGGQEDFGGYGGFGGFGGSSNYVPPTQAPPPQAAPPQVGGGQEDFAGRGGYGGFGGSSNYVPPTSAPPPQAAPVPPQQAPAGTGGLGGFGQYLQQAQQAPPPPPPSQMGGFAGALQQARPASLLRQTPASPGGKGARPASPGGKGARRAENIAMRQGSFANFARGGLASLPVQLDNGSFIIPEEDVNTLGLQALLQMGGELIDGPGTGESDSIPAIIGGEEEARVSAGEVVFDRDDVKRLGGPDFFRELMAKAAQMRQGTDEGAYGMITEAADMPPQGYQEG